MKYEGLDVLSYLDSRNIPYVTEGKNVGAGWVGITCLWCSDSGTHLGINMLHKGFSCFRCGEKGSIIKLIQEIDHCSPSKAYAIAKKFVDPNYSNDSYVREQSSDTVALPLGVSKRFSDRHLEYLKKRNFDPEFLIKKYDLYAGGTVGEFKYRIVIPVFVNQRLVTLVGRDITGLSDQRYKALAIAKSITTVKSALYNIDSVKDVVVIVEGVFDCWRIGDGCVATFGTKVTNEQILLLKGIKQAFILFDAEAQSEANSLAVRVSSIVPNVEILSLDHGDPAEMTVNEVQYLRKEIKLL